LIGSALIHIALFAVVAKTSPKADVTMHEVGAFIIATPIAQAAEPTRSIRSGSGTEIDRLTPEASQLQASHENGKSASPVASQIRVEASPSKEAPVSTEVKPVQSVQPATAENTTQISQQPTRSKEEYSGSKLSGPSRQSSGTGQVMVLGDVGSPRFTHRESPIYPFMARKLGKEGKVVLRLTLDAQGQLQGVDTIETNGFGFAESASAAIRKSTFAPAVKNGCAISSQVLVQVRFVLHEGQ
jgi:protein TonB